MISLLVCNSAGCCRSFILEVQASFFFTQIAEVREKLTHRHEKIMELERHMLEITNSVRQETEVLEKERQELLEKMAKVFVIVFHKNNSNRIILT